MFEAWTQADNDARHRFAGSMRWSKRNAKEYLLRKTGKVEKSLGPRSPGTDTAYQAFISGRADNKTRLQSLTRRLDTLAAVNRALGMGRIPQVAARILRKLNREQLLGHALIVAGTNALYAYEALAGVRFDSGLTATLDIDLLFDTRARLRLAITDETVPAIRNLIGILQQADKSFQLLQPRSFRAVNKDGYMVDLIRPQHQDELRQTRLNSVFGSEHDIESAPIEGLDYLVNAPRTSAIALDERGYPLHVSVPDPRAFAVHKLWLSKRKDRNAAKKTRDLAQAHAAAAISTQLLTLSFSDPSLAALPAAMLAGANELGNTGEPAAGTEPAW